MKMTMNMDTLQSLESLPLEAARAEAIGLISKKTKPARYAHLVRDIGLAKNAQEVSRIMWNVLLAGEGLNRIDSAWQKLHGAAKKV